MSTLEKASDSASAAVDRSALERSTIRKVTVRLAPFLGLMFFVNYLDRTAIAFAAPNGMNQSLGLTSAQFGIASGVFFLGYILLEVPSNLALHRFGARRWLSRIMVSWGLVALCFTLVNSFLQLAALRVLLGLAEAGFVPGAILYLSSWAPARHRGRLLGLFLTALPLTSIVGPPIAGWLITYDGAFGGLEGWRFMFLGVGLPAVVVGVVAWFYLTDSPEKARWLTAEEKRWLRDELETEQAATAALRAARPGLRAVFRNPKVWMIGFIGFGFAYGVYTLAFYLPTIIADFQIEFGLKFSVFERGLVTSIPYVPAAAVMLLATRHATRHGLSRRHIVVPALVAAVAMPLAVLVPSPELTIALIAVVACAVFAILPNLWTLPSRFLSGASAAAGIGLINSIANISGFASTVVTGQLTRTAGVDEFFIAALVMSGCLVVSAVLMVLLRHEEDAPAAQDPVVPTS